MRTSGAINKPKYIKVKISELTKVFQPDTEIEISVAYSILFPASLPALKEETGENGENGQNAPIDFTVS